MTNVVCVKVANLRKQGIENLEQWMADPDNVYTGRRGRIFIHEDGKQRIFHYKASKWQNPYNVNEYELKKSLQLYVIHLFQTGLIYDIDELRGKNLGCFCEKKKGKGDEPMCHAQILADLLGRCYEPIEELIRRKQTQMKPMKPLPTGTITITFGEQAEGHHGMEIIGAGRLKNGLNVEDLKGARKKFEEMGAETEWVDLNELLPPDIKGDSAAVLIIRDGVNTILGEIGKEKNDILREQANLNWDKKAWMRGRVVNKRARFNLVYGAEAQEPDYENRKGRVIPWSDIPLTNKIREMLPYYFGEKAEDLKAEGNYYYKIDECGIGFHGDTERKVVIAVRLGEAIPIQYQWFQRGEPIGDRAEYLIRGGDIYAMSEKAAGSDWHKKIIPTLRHAAGCRKYFVIKPKKKPVLPPTPPPTLPPTPSGIELVPSIYKGKGKAGDFEMMVKQPAYVDALFVFNDNEEAFLKQSCAKGNGNAAVRPYQCKNPPRATGISTGYYIRGKVNAGYTSLSDGNAKKVIDQGIQKIRKLLETGRYKRVIYSSNGRGGLGTGIFDVGSNVKTYIVNELKSVV